MDVNGSSSNDASAGNGTALEPAQFTWRSLPGLNGRRTPDFQVVIHQSVLDEIHAHGHTRRDAEVCGVLVGLPCRDDTGPYLHIEACIRGENAASATANVTFTAQTWTHIQSEMDRLHPDQKIVGWYHTHPGFGIFLSGMDLFIHQSFFDLPWQVAFVYDPLGKDEGSFVWSEGKPVRKPFLVQSDQSTQVKSVPILTVTDPKPSGGRLGGYIYILIALLTLAAVVWYLWTFYRMGSGVVAPSAAREAAIWI